MLTDATPEPAPSPARVLRNTFWLTSPAWLALALELIGGIRFDHPLNLGGWRNVLIGIVLVAVVLSPALVVVAVFKSTALFRKSAFPTQLKFGISLFLLLALCVSLFSCAWSCGGHPTWSNGYR